MDNLHPIMRAALAPFSPPQSRDEIYAPGLPDAAMRGPRGRVMAWATEAELDQYAEDSAYEFDACEQAWSEQ